MSTSYDYALALIDNEVHRDCEYHVYKLLRDAVDALEAENAKMRLEVENAKLRELATSAMFMLFNDSPCGGCDFADECDEQGPNGSCLMKDELQRIAERLGIEP